MSRSVAVFGETGFIGRAVRSAMLARDWTLVDTSPGGRRLDISTPSGQLDEVTAAADVVVNCAGRAHRLTTDPAVFWPANVDGARHVAESAGRSARTSRLVHVSSVSVGSAGLAPAAGSALPDTAYGATKAAGELLVGAAARRHDLELVVVRPAGIAGPDAPGAWGTLWRRVAAGRPIPVPRPGPRHDVVAIDAVADFLARAAVGAVDPGVHALAGQHPVTIEEYVRLVGAVLGRDVRLVEVPASLLAGLDRGLDVLAGVSARLGGVHQQVATVSSPPRPVAGRAVTRLATLPGR